MVGPASLCAVPAPMTTAEDQLPPDSVETSTSPVVTAVQATIGSPLFTVIDGGLVVRAAVPPGLTVPSRLHVVPS